MAGHRPDIVREDSERPRPWLYQCDNGRPHAEFPLTEISGVGGSWQYESRTDAPDDLAFLRHQKKRWVHISQAIDACGLHGGRGRLHRNRLVDDRRNPANEEVPVFRYT